jgi:hypothetical protein
MIDEEGKKNNTINEYLLIGNRQHKKGDYMSKSSKRDI